VDEGLCVFRSGVVQAFRPAPDEKRALYARGANLFAIEVGRLISRWGGDWWPIFQIGVGVGGRRPRRSRAPATEPARSHRGTSSRPQRSALEAWTSRFARSNSAVAKLGVGDDLQVVPRAAGPEGPSPTYVILKCTLRNFAAMDRIELSTRRFSVRRTEAIVPQMCSQT
jgi:hypothetical protein